MKAALETSLFHSVRTSAALLPVITFIGLWRGGVWAWTGFALVFGFYFLVEAVLWVSGLGVKVTADDEFKFVSFESNSLIDRYGVAVYGLLLILALPAGAFWLAGVSRSGTEICGGALSLMVMAGSVGGLAGHEYIHRRTKWGRRLGIFVYGVMYYQHFFVSHLQGHHRSVGLEDDWSTAREHETLYGFLWRAFVHGYVGAWRLEARRLKNKGTSVFSRENFMIKAAIGQIGLAAAVFGALGPRALGFHLAISLAAMTLMETINYISHYGLVRRRDAEGRLEPISDFHSWESNNKVTNWFIFNAGKHCHHHRRPSDSHDQLILAQANEYIPVGLPLMTLISFLPPVFFAIMDPMLSRARDRAEARRVSERLNERSNESGKRPVAAERDLA